MVSEYDLDAPGRIEMEHRRATPNERSARLSVLTRGTWSAPPRPPRRAPARSPGSPTRMRFGNGADAPHRMAVRPPLAFAPRGRKSQAANAGKAGAIARVALPRIQVNWIMAGLAATIDAVTPASVRLSPCESEILRPDEPWARRCQARPPRPAPASCRRSGRRMPTSTAGLCPDLRPKLKSHRSFRRRSPS